MKYKYPLIKNNISRDDLDNVIDYLKQKDPKLTQGSNVKKFEQKWSKWLGVKYSVFVNSGSSANFISLKILKETRGIGEVIMTPFTWSSDINSVIENGFKPVFIDIDLKNLSIDENKILKKINAKTKALFITHAQGFNGLSSKILNILKQKKIVLIEDVCESHGAYFKLKKLGTFGSISNFSFYYAHHLSTIEGGMVCTDDKNIYNLAKIIRGHGMLREVDDKNFIRSYLNKFPDLNPKFIFTHSGYNMRNNEISAIIGINQLKRIDKNILKRNKNKIKFIKLIDKEKFYTDFDLIGQSNYAFNLILKKPDNKLMNKLCNTLEKNGIEFRKGSVGGGNQLRQPYLKKIYRKNFHLNFPNTEHLHFYSMYIGNYPDLNKIDIEYICKIINSC